MPWAPSTGARTRSLEKIRLPMRSGVSVDRPGVEYLWTERSADHRGELRQYSDFALLGQRKWRHVSVRVPADRRPGGAQTTNIAWPRPRRRAVGTRRAPVA